jgi:ElaB/YqjD/DUF883 family membrane-anchored ribosome-binding protein
MKSIEKTQNEMMESVQDFGRRTVSELDTQIKAAQNTAKIVQSKSYKFVKDNPLIAAGVALGAGVLLGMFATSSFKKKS